MTAKMLKVGGVDSRWTWRIGKSDALIDSQVVSPQIEERESLEGMIYKNWDSPLRLRQLCLSSAEDP